MFNNIIDAIPQAGIANADIVYEAPVEGGNYTSDGKLWKITKTLPESGLVEAAETIMSIMRQNSMQFTVILDRQSMHLTFWRDRRSII